MEDSNMFPFSSSVTELYFFFFKLSFFMKIKIAFLFKQSSMLTSSTLDVGRDSNS